MSRAFERRSWPPRLSKPGLLIAGPMAGNNRNGKGKAQSHRHNSLRQDGRNFPASGEITGCLRFRSVDQLGQAQYIPGGKVFLWPTHSIALNTTLMVPRLSDVDSNRKPSCGERISAGKGGNNC